MPRGRPQRGNARQAQRRGWRAPRGRVNDTWPSQFRSGRWNETGVSRRASSPGSRVQALPVAAAVRLDRRRRSRPQQRERHRGCGRGRRRPSGDLQRDRRCLAFRDSNSWWLFAVGVPLLFWTGFTGAKAVVLVHSLVWDEPPPRPKPVGSLVFTGMVCAAIITVALSSWFADVAWHGLLAAALTIAPLTGLRLWVSLHLPHRDAPWRALLPGALLIGIGVPVLSGLVDAFLSG